jgi:uncharacterized 2Fe-2S/4Fe-4S cluster protein (DUF4445 family)
MEIRILNRDTVCQGREGESLLSALARNGIVLSAPCGGRGLCEKCAVRLVRGEIRGTVPDRSGVFLACRGIPVTDVAVEFLSDEAPAQNEVEPLEGAAFLKKAPARAGLALDIGTTTLSARLVDLDTAETLDTCSELNDQRIFGADVMSRIGAARNGKTGELFALINRQTGQILGRFLRKWNIPQVERLAVTGNTTMLHLFTNTDPSGMGEIPFTPVFLESREFTGKDLCLRAERITLLPSIGAFVGGDIVAGLGALDILAGADNSLLIDIGTNGEMALFRGGRIDCCSTAAGPAFEGAEISCGMGSVNGAIDTITKENGKLSFTTIGGGAPRGICGCGLIDAMALMLREGIIDETGALDDAYRDGFTITEGITLVNLDVRQYQLAKSAILSGIKILCKNAGLSPADISAVYIAGGLGFFINKQNAAATGLLPAEFLDKIAVCGNLSLRGAQRCLEDPGFLARCAGIAARSACIDLAANPEFMDEFAANMLF